MKKIHIIVLANIVALTFIGGIAIAAVPSKVSYEVKTIKVPVIVPTNTDGLTKQQKVWLGALEWCESRGKETAVNPIDRDGTASYGLLQFKPGTFSTYQKLYSLSTSTRGYMDPDIQEQIVAGMIKAGNTNWYQQFPDCTRRLGTPPKSPL